MEKNRVGVRKGAWTKEEDTLLRICVQTYGEGNWHKVPLRAGLNRCRKSCRLRWLNYLRPNIKRGYFTSDEVDLMCRLHKLLGNRWSIIAGRLPGRTANDVKNFWNTYINRTKPRAAAAAAAGTCEGRQTITKTNIARPRPRTLSKLHVPPGTTALPKPSNPNEENHNHGSTSTSEIRANDDEYDKQPYSSSQEEVDACLRWWSDLLETAQTGEGNSFLCSNEDGGIRTQPVLSTGFPDHGSNGPMQEGFSLPLDDDCELLL